MAEAEKVIKGIPRRDGVDIEIIREGTRTLPTNKRVRNPYIDEGTNSQQSEPLRSGPSSSNSSGEKDKSH